MLKVVTLIPARGGSKGIPRKNIIDICGKPLIAYAIEASLKSDSSETWVSTDDDEIAKISREYGAKVIKRPSEIATDNATSESALLHFANQDEPVLPVHDSFIVHHGHKQELENVMSVAFKKKFKKEVAIKAEPRDPVRFDLTIPKTKDAEFREMDISIEGLMKAADHTRDWSARN